MTKVVIDMTMSLDRFVAGPGNGRDYPRDRLMPRHIEY